MGHILSKFSEIDNITFKKFPARPTKGLVVARTSYGDTVWGQDPEKRWIIYTTSHQLTRGFAFTTGDWRWQEAAMAALVKFKVVTAEVAAEHVRFGKAIERRRNAKDTLKHVARDLGKFGVKLTATQVRRLTKIAETK